MSELIGCTFANENEIERTKYEEDKSNFYIEELPLLWRGRCRF